MREESWRKLTCAVLYGDILEVGKPILMGQDCHKKDTGSEDDLGLDQQRQVTLNLSY